MSTFVRPRANGRAFELRIKHKLLPKPVYLTFSTGEAAREYGQRAHEFMDRGIVPEGLVPKPKFAFTTIAGAIRAYERARSVPRSTENVLATVIRDVGSTPLVHIDYAWCESWVLAQKLEHNRSPGTIRHHVGALARCFAWVCLAYPTYLAVNPLRQLERGYSSYNERERKTVAAKGWEPKEDTERDRRLEPREEAETVRVLNERIARETDPALKAWHAGALLMFLLALESAMRMRELYTLERAQLNLEGRTIHLTRTKNGDRRNVPITSVAFKLISEALSQRVLAPTDLLFPFWNHNRDERVLEETTSRVSNYFGGVFDEAGCPDFTFHCTRHEATCRIVLRTRLDATQIARITGHKDPRMLRRYMALRGSELAALMW